ncbi:MULTISPECIES: murein biosynthesis integral membrane protein MurJ [Geobacillus]|nr:MULTISPECIES: murein biosynthesis integral membrane protein MurJ [Geobacillus]ARA98441.1 murein biosynthesis protein MurJ [Geobacillus thermodenitrificans]ATO37807.1 murein biosynthesis protein MurJ [Geobacillus thermodenitrificans]KQB91788.1 membrane protein [Geobacillus sp. PA-3]MED3904379.1 murein biosynthesis integral membrane protein MurJ [Geobacillus thermodenitrificans]NNU88135.1 murein biosynthesis integral membrane protein MurJ [Geobacillus sp. MR]
MPSLKRTAIWITLLALVVKVAGFLRESIIAKEFGANEYTDGYLLAFSFITLVLAVISVGFNNVFLPLYVQAKQNNPKAAERNANGIMNATVAIFLLVAVLGYLLAPSFVPAIFGRMAAVTESVAIHITQIFFLFMGAIALNGILDSYLQGRRIFVPSQISKLLATLMGAVFALLFSDVWGIYSLAYGFVFGIMLGIVLMFVYLYRSGYRWTPTLSIDPDFRQTFLRLLVPSLLNAFVGQMNMFIDKIFASGTIEGAVTYLNNASLLVSIPHTIYGTTVAAILFTLLSEQVDKPRQFQQTFFTGMELSLITLMPVAAGLWVIGDAAIAIVYERGQFTETDTYRTYVALLFYLPLIVTQGLQYIVAKSMYAKGKTAVVLRISVTTIVLNIILNYALVQSFGYAGIALSSSLVSLYYVTACSIAVYKEFERGEAKKLISLLVRVGSATAIMAGLLYGLKEVASIHQWPALLALAVLVPLGVAIYIAGVYALYREGFYRLLRTLRSKRKPKPSA